MAMPRPPQHLLVPLKYEFLHPSVVQPDKKKIFEDWKRKLQDEKWSLPTDLPIDDMNKLVLDHLISSGHVAAAEAFRRETGQTDRPLLDHQKVQQLQEVERLITKGNMASAIDLISDVDPQFLDNPETRFNYERQHLIELIRQGDPEGALALARTTLQQLSQSFPNGREKLEQTMLIFAFSLEEMHKGPYGKLFEVSKRHRLAKNTVDILVGRMGLVKSASSGEFHLLQAVHWMENELSKSKRKRIDFPKLRDLLSSELPPSLKPNSESNC